MRNTEIKIVCEAKEIAALVLELQEQHGLRNLQESELIRDIFGNVYVSAQEVGQNPFLVYGGEYVRNKDVAEVNVKINGLDEAIQKAELLAKKTMEARALAGELASMIDGLEIELET